MDEMPVLGQAVPGGVLAHGGDADAVGKGEAADSQGFEEVGHGVDSVMWAQQKDDYPKY